MDRKKYSRVCSVPGCDVHMRKISGISFFSLPKSITRSQYWLDQICVKKQPDQRIYVCEEHFEDALINRANPKQKRLDIDAVPTLKLPSRLGTTSLTPIRNDDTITDEQLDELSEHLPKDKRKASEHVSQQSEKKIKTDTNAPSKTSEEGAVLSWQPTGSQSTSKQLKDIEYGYRGNDLKPKNLPDKQRKEINEDTTTSQSQQDIILINLTETTQESDIETLNERSTIPSSNNIQVHKNALTEKILEPIKHATIKSSCIYTEKLQNIQTKMDQISNSTKAHIQLSLKLYLRFPNEYKILHKALHALPKSELKSTFKDSLISADGFTLFSIYLTQKANTMTVPQKQCFLCIGQSKIKPKLYYDIQKDHLLGIHDIDDVLKPEFAKTAVVMILQGIFEEWKQPIAVGYLRSDSRYLRPWIESNVKTLFNMGFNVRAIVSHRDSNYFYKHININKMKIYCINDISYLFITLYYNFTKCNYCFHSFIANCQHIVDFYKSDHFKLNPLTPNITEKLLNPANIEELNIESVMEVFNMSTAAAISVYIDLNVLHPYARQTSVFITKIRKLYDILNVGPVNDKTKKGYEGGDSDNIYFLKEMLAFFDSLTILTQTANPDIGNSHKTVVDNFKTLIKTVMSLYANFTVEKYDHLPFYRLNTDSVDLFFDQVQKHSKSITKPTAKDVDLIFRQTAIIHLLKHSVKNTKTNELDEVLDEFQKLITSFKLLSDDYAHLDLAISYKVSSSEYMMLDTKRNDGIVFLAGFLLKKCNDVHNNCDDLKAYNRRTTTDVEALFMCESIMEDIRQNICALPSIEFIELVESLEISFRSFMNREILYVPNKKMLVSLLKFMESVDLRMPCQCFPVIYAKKLYLRFRIYHTLKYNNELARTKLSKLLVVNKL